MLPGTETGLQTMAIAKITNTQHNDLQLITRWRKKGASPLSATNSKFHRAGISQPALLFFQDNHYLREYFKHYFA